jgi:ribonuclease HI
MKITKVFTDGSTLNNQNSKKNQSFGGYGGYLIYSNGEEEQFTEPLEGDKITNQIAELTAYKHSLKKIIDKQLKDFIYIYTDSMYLINIYTKWIKKWEADGWKKADGKNIENLDLIKEIYNLILDSKLKIFYKHVKAHQEKPSDEKSEKYFIWFGNNKADELATYAANIVKEKYMENKKNNV